jgi:hypothetical protein
MGGASEIKGARPRRLTLWQRGVNFWVCAMISTIPPGHHVSKPVHKLFCLHLGG